jgi:peptidyl-prolyl cis-trans isomerase D
MLDSLREQLQDRNTKIILAVGVVVALLAPTLGIFLGRGSGKPVIAFVNDQEVTVQEFRSRFYENEQIKRQTEQQFGQYAQMVLQYYGLSGDIQQATLDQLIKDKLIKDAIEKLGFAISDEYIAEKLKDPLFIKQSLGQLIPDAVLTKDGHIDTHLLKRYLNERGITLDSFDDLVRETVERSILSELIVSTVYVPERVLKDEYIKEYVPRSYTYVSLDVDQFEKDLKKQNISQETLTEYFNNHIESYRIPEKRSANMWEFSANDFDISIADKDIKAYYNEHKDSYRKDTQDKNGSVSYKPLKDVEGDIKAILTNQAFIKMFNRKAPSIINQARKNADAMKAFIDKHKGSEKTEKNIEHDGSKKTQKLFKLKNTQSYSFYTQGDKGYIMQLTDITPSTLPSFEDVKENVKQDYMSYESQQMLEKEVKDIYKRAKQKQSLDDIASTNGMKLKKVTLDPTDQEKIDKLSSDNVPTDVLKNATVKNMPYMSIETGKGFVVFVTDVSSMDEGDFKDKKEVLLSRLKRAQENMNNQAFVANLRKNATISYNK